MVEKLSNFPFKWNGKEYWYSRSIVCSNYIFCKYCGEWYVLVAQRSDDSTWPKRWNVPGGFLDHDETTLECAIRETFEETGFYIPNDSKVVLHNINDRNRQGKQHIIFSYYTNLGEVELTPWVSNRSSETATVDWIPVKKTGYFTWIPGQYEMIQDIFQQHINHSTFRDWMMDKIFKYFANMIYIKS